MQREAMIEVQDLAFAWPQQAPLLKIPQLTIAASERVFLKGPSGSGKSTLLGLLGGVNLPCRGQIKLLGQDLTQLSAAQRDQFRADHCGFIFQQFNLLPFLTVLQNVVLGCQFSKTRQQKARQRFGSVLAAAEHLLNQLGLAKALYEQPASSLSIGQQQRVAVARGLIGAPELLIADEPTSALDADTRGRFLELLFNESQASQTSVLFVSHDQSLASQFDRQLDLLELNQVPWIQQQAEVV
ncbi:ABC transporter ATP-binding protein [Thiopseudomonas alkaliphila]|uniref:ABC transporter ATP-binding protein n=1 Tax=Thiopseudomonas alkaliphila TaxID=1697053 RepID=A0AAW7DQX7_9GAMM|nr:ABC transporter ATP-binding protein [Thiopseudomonas alkaliphila]MDM1695725.1 ABC transporter ATP-binding protein [Thiopseudomonas alkaliphila]